MWKWAVGLFLMSLTTWLPAQVDSASQLITIPVATRSVQETISEISQQSGYDFSYNAHTINQEQVLSFGVQQATLEQTLTEFCKLIAVDFVFIDQQIVLRHQDLAISKDTNRPKYYSISGIIRDASTGESLIGATISVGGTTRGTVTNAFGYYALQLPAGSQKLSYSYIGYQQQDLAIRLDQNKKENISLGLEAVDLPNVIITLPFQNVMDRKEIGKMSLRPINLQQMPEFAGESGLIKGLQSLPGIKTHSDGSAFFYTRGGEKDQNLIIIDDAPIFNPAHLFGFYSVVIPDFTKEISVYKSDIPVNLGDRLSSITSIRTKDGNLYKTRFSGALNALINRFSLEFPTSKGKGSLFTSVRRSNFEWIYQRANPDLDLAFADFNFKWNHSFNQKNRLFFTLITGVDNFTNQADTSNAINWANVAMTLRWNHIFGPRLFSNTTLYSGSYNYRLRFNNNSWKSGIGTIGLKSDFTHFISPAIKANFGLELSSFGFEPGILTSNNLLNFIPKINSHISTKRVVYYQADFTPSKKWKLSAGARLLSWDNFGPAEYFSYGPNSEIVDTVSQPEGPYHTYTNVDPRLSAKYFLDSTSHLKFSFGNYHQYLHLISNSVSPFTSLEVWLPSGPNIKPQQSTQIDLGFLKYFPRSKIEWSASLYYKKLRQQIDYVPHARTLINPELEAELRFGKMDAYGLELMVKKDFGQLSGWLSYTWSRAIRQTDAINGGRSYPAFQDRPHDISLMLNYQASKRLLVSGYFTAYTGSAFSSPTGFYTFNEQTVPIYGEKNNDRLPNYQRLDFALRYTLNKNPQNKYQHSLTFSIYNALAHKNIVAVNFNKVLNGDNRPEVQANFLRERDLVTTQADLIRFFPSLTYKFKI